MKALLPLLALILLGCEAVPVVTPKVNVVAFRNQNKTTQTHIKQTQQHIDKNARDDTQADTHVKNAEKALDQLLK